ncbi:MAG TPA: TIM barrel protein [Patescibacteria group bacterium]|nr:TIM barrel protein [Patescibacteria group bacterium]
MAKNQCKRGVTLYSYQEEYYTGAMTLEDCVAEVASMGAEGVEVIAEEMVPNYPDPPESWVKQWHGLMAKYHTKPACLDTFVDLSQGGHRNMTLPEAVETLATQFKLAKRMGFPAVRPSLGRDQLDPIAIVEKALPEAERTNVKIALELHAPTSLTSKGKGSRMQYIDRYMELLSKTKATHFGFTPDMGIFARRLPRVMLNYYLRHGAHEKTVQYIDTAFQNGANTDEIAAEVAKMNPNGQDQRCAAVASGYGWRGNDPKELQQIMPYIYNIHGKFYEMTEELTEYSIPYEEVVPVLMAGGYDGYINSEYEGQRWTQDATETDSCEEIRRHHVMLKRILGV